MAGYKAMSVEWMLNLNEILILTHAYRHQSSVNSSALIFSLIRKSLPCNEIARSINKPIIPDQLVVAGGLVGEVEDKWKEKGFKADLAATRCDLPSSPFGVTCPRPPTHPPPPPDQKK